MKLRRRKKEVPGLNTTATADISFMLLVFFLVTTSMYVDKGLARQMSPKEDESAETIDINIANDKIVVLHLDATGEVFIGDSLANFKRAKDNITDLLRRCPSDHILSLSADAKCPYDAYFQLQNIITESYAEIRNELSQKKYGRDFKQLINTDRESILKQCPQRVAEDYDVQEGGME